MRDCRERSAVSRDDVGQHSGVRRRRCADDDEKTPLRLEALSQHQFALYRARINVATVLLLASCNRPKTLIVARRAELELAYQDG